MISLVQLRRSPTRTRTSDRPQSARRPVPRLCYLDDRKWKPYRNDPELALQIYDLTHPAAQTFAELEREAELADTLKPYETAVIHLSELLRSDFSKSAL